MRGFSVAALCVLGSGCVSDSANGSAADQDDRGAATDAGTGAPMVAPGDCLAQVTKAACLGVPDWELFPHLEDSPIEGCYWQPTYRVIDQDACELEPFGGSCVPPSYDDGCDGLYGQFCSDESTAVGYIIDDDGVVRLGLGDSNCYTGPLISCPNPEDVPAGTTGSSDVPIECACGCSIEES